VLPDRLVEAAILPDAVIGRPCPTIRQGRGRGQGRDGDSRLRILHDEPVRRIAQRHDVVALAEQLGLGVLEGPEHFGIRRQPVCRCRQQPVQRVLVTRSAPPWRFARWYPASTCEHSTDQGAGIRGLDPGCRCLHRGQLHDLAQILALDRARRVRPRVPSRTRARNG
jgi:hypothetical protein